MSFVDLLDKSINSDTKNNKENKKGDIPFYAGFLYFRCQILK